MRSFRISVLLALLLCVDSAQAYRVLFVGNSFTGYSIPTLQRFARANPLDRDVFGYEVVGGISLSEHARRAATLARIRDGQWDYVVLQDHSTQAIRQADQFSSGIETLVDAVRTSGAEPILFQTWARLQTGNYPGDQAVVSRAYLDIAMRLSVAVARVGDVWFEMYRNNGSIFARMFDPDGIHPTDFGTFAVAISIYSVMYEGSLAWAPTSGVGSAGDTIRAVAVRINTTRPPYTNPANCSISTRCSNSAETLPAIHLLLLD